MESANKKQKTLTSFFSRGTIPVSYTHLDVYKRQVEECGKNAKVECNKLYCLVKNYAVKKKTINAKK